MSTAYDSASGLGMTQSGETSHRGSYTASGQKRACIWGWNRSVLLAAFADEAAFIISQIKRQRIGPALATLSGAEIAPM